MEFENIFASPAEPCFARVLKSWDTEILNNMLEDWIFHLRNQSKMSPGDRKWRNTLPFLVVPDSVVQLIFLISEKLEQPNEVRYLTVELFDRFMMRHFSMLHESVYNKTSVKQSDRLWEKVISRVQNQTLLRLMSCMQLASKLTAHYQLPLNSPLAYVETLLAILLKDSEKWNKKKNDQSFFEPLYKTCVQVLDLAFIMHRELYNHLFWMVTGRKGPIGEHRNQFLCVECDDLLLSAAVICCAAKLHLQEEKDLPQRVLTHLAFTTAIPRKDIAELAVALSKISFGHSLP